MRSEDIEQALEQSFDQDPKKRRSALQHLCPCHVRADVPEIWERLFEMQSDPDTTVRSIILHSLCDGSPRSREPQVLAALEALAHDPDRQLRRRARQALAQHKRTGRINQE